MSFRAGALVLVSALLHATWNALIKRERDPRSAGLAVLAVAALVAVALVPSSHRPAFETPRGAAWGLAAGVFEGGYFAALGMALARGSLGPTYTVARGGAMIATWPISVLVLGEQFSGLAGLGASLIVAGLAFTALRSGEPASSAGLGWATLCAACIGGYHLSYKIALAAGAEPRALFAVALGCALPINLVSLGRGGFRDAAAALRRSPLRIGVGGATCTLSFVLFLEALAVTGAGAVLTLRNTSVLFAQLFAMWGGERLTRRALAGAALVVAGAVLIARS